MLLDILKNTTLVTSLVMTMLLFIEYINVSSQARSLSSLRKSTTRQVLLATLLGIVPGCIGGFASVSLFTHGVINFGALVGSLIATMGDEAFVMLALFPKQALLLQGILVLVGLAAAFVINRFWRGVQPPFAHNHLHLHDADQQGHHHHQGPIHSSSWRNNLRHLSFQRALLIAGLVFFIVATFSGILEHSHEHVGEVCEHGEAHGHTELFSERWLNILFSLVAMGMLVVIVRVSDHFLEAHLWGHVIKKHFLKIFLWTLGAFIIIALLEHHIEAANWVRSNYWYMLAAAILIGLIPASGPHLVFVFLFASGGIPFYILLANTLVQDGHAGLPLLAESKKAFVYNKLIKVGLALIVGLVGAM